MLKKLAQDLWKEIAVAIIMQFTGSTFILIGLKPSLWISLLLITLWQILIFLVSFMHISPAIIAYYEEKRRKEHIPSTQEINQETDKILEQQMRKKMLS